MLNTSLYNLVCASKERLTKVLFQQGITIKVCANTNYYGKQWLNLHTGAFEQCHLERNDDAQLSVLADGL